VDVAKYSQQQLFDLSEQLSKSVPAASSTAFGTGAAGGVDGPRPTISGTASAGNATVSFFFDEETHGVPFSG
jgi:hypothetical protein